MYAYHQECMNPAIIASLCHAFVVQEHVLTDLDQIIIYK